MTTQIDYFLKNRIIDAIVIGCSAGGINALLRILPGLPADFDFAVVIVVHVPDDGDNKLPQVFAQHLAMPVMHAVDKAPVEAGVVYFAASGYHLSIETDRTFSLSREEPVHFSRPAIDILMESAAEAYRARLIGILLTGASADGAAGLVAISEAGGLTVVQDPFDAEISIMPRSAITLRTPDLTLPLNQIRELLTKLGTL